MCGPTCLKYLKLALFRESLPTPGRLGCDFCFAIAQLSSDHFVVMLPAVPLLPHFFPGDRQAQYASQWVQSLVKPDYASGGARLGLLGRQV